MLILDFIIYLSHLLLTVTRFFKHYGLGSVWQHYIANDNRVIRFCVIDDASVISKQWYVIPKGVA